VGDEEKKKVKGSSGTSAEKSGIEFPRRLSQTRRVTKPKGPNGTSLRSRNAVVDEEGGDGGRGKVALICRHVEASDTDRAGKGKLLSTINHVL